MFKKKYILALYLLSAIEAFSQNYKVAEVKKYFTANADRLDPIEGVWKRNASLQYNQQISIDTTRFCSQPTYMIVFKKNDCYVAADFNNENEAIRQGCSLAATKNLNQYAQTILYYNNSNVQLTIVKGQIISDFYYKESIGNDSTISIHCIERYVRIYPTEKEIQRAQLNNPDYFLEEGIKSFRKKEYSNSIKLLDKSIELNAGLSDAYYFKASAYYQKKDFSHALADINTAIKLKTNSADYYSLRGSINVDLKNFAQAISDFSKSIEVKPAALVYYNRSIAEYSINDFKAAINDCNKAIELSSSAILYNQRAWYLFKTRDFKNALMDASAAIRLDSKDANSYDTRGCIYFGSNQYTEALADFNQAIKLNPTLGNSYLYRGRIKLLTGQRNEACKDWNTAAELGDIEGAEFIKKYCR